MSDKRQTDGRKSNGALSGGRPDASTSEKSIKETGKQEQRTAGPDGPSAKEVGDTFKS